MKLAITYEEIIGRCHKAIGESEHSDHDSLPDAIATHIRERDQRIDELERELAEAETELERRQAKIMRLSAPSALASHDALKLCRKWIEHDEGRTLEEILAIERRAHKQLGKGAYNEDFIAMCLALAASTQYVGERT